MFEEFLGLPAHPLLVHAAVVFVPLLAIVAVLYALVPVVRHHIRWVLVVLAIGTPLAALFTKLSGDAFFDRMDAAGRITEGFYPVLENHQTLGNWTLISATVLGVVTLALVYLVPPRGVAAPRVGSAAMVRNLSVAVRVLVVLVAVASLVFVFMAGDSGARAVWEGY